MRETPINKGLLEDSSWRSVRLELQRRGDLELLVSGSQVRALVRPPSQKSLLFSTLLGAVAENKRGVVRRFLLSYVAQLDCCAAFLLACIFIPFDTARGYDGTGRVRSPRRIGY